MVHAHDAQVTIPADTSWVLAAITFYLRPFFRLQVQGSAPAVTTVPTVPGSLRGESSSVATVRDTHARRGEATHDAVRQPPQITRLYEHSEGPRTQQSVQVMPAPSARAACRTSGFGQLALTRGASTSRWTTQAHA